MLAEKADVERILFLYLIAEISLMNLEIDYKTTMVGLLHKYMTRKNGHKFKQSSDTIKNLRLSTLHERKLTNTSMKLVHYKIKPWILIR